MSGRQAAAPGLPGRRRGSLSWELRTSISLARLLTGRGGSPSTALLQPTIRSGAPRSRQTASRYANNDAKNYAFGSLVFMTFQTELCLIIDDQKGHAGRRRWVLVEYIGPRKLMYERLKKDTVRTLVPIQIVRFQISDESKEVAAAPAKSQKFYHCYKN